MIFQKHILSKCHSKTTRGKTEEIFEKRVSAEVAIPCELLAQYEITCNSKVETRSHDEGASVRELSVYNQSCRNRNTTNQFTPYFLLLCQLAGVVSPPYIIFVVATPLLLRQNYDSEFLYRLIVS